MIPGLGSLSSLSDSFTAIVKTHRGTFLCVEPGGRLICDREKAQAWEEFKIFVVGRDSATGQPIVELKTAHGPLLRVPRKKPGLSGVFSVFLQDDDVDTFFTLIVSGKEVALKTRSGKYVSFNDDGSVVGDKNAIGSTELVSFTLIEESATNHHRAASSELRMRVFQTIIGSPDFVKEKSPLAFRFPSSDTDEKKPLFQFDRVTLAIDDTRMKQTINGFGASLTEKSCQLVSSLDAEKRKWLMDQLFSPNEAGICLSLLRVPIGSASYEADENGDLVLRKWDLAGSENLEESFSLENEDAYVGPVLKEALARSSLLKIVATPSSPPEWLLNESGSLAMSDAKLMVYSSYLIAYLDAFKRRKGTEAGVAALALNENGLGQPSQERLGNVLKMDLKKRSVELFVCGAIESPILDYADGIEWISSDACAESYRARGNQQALINSSEILSTSKNQFKYFVERTIEMAASQCSSLTLCSLVEDASGVPAFEANVNGVLRGFFALSGKVPLATEAFFALSHTSRFVKPGARVIFSRVVGSDQVATAAYKNPDSSIVVVVLNKSNVGRFVIVEWGGASVEVGLQGDACVTLVF